MKRHVMSLLVVMALVVNTAFAEPLLAGQSGRSGSVPSGTTLRLILEDRLDSEYAQEGDRFRSRVAQDVVHEGRVMIPRGSVVAGTVVEVEDAERLAGLAGNASMTLRFDHVWAYGRWHPMSATLVSVHDRVAGVDDEEYFGDRSDRDIDEEGRLEAETDLGDILKKGAIGVGAGALLGALFGNVSRGLIIGSIGSAVAILAPEGEEVTLEEGAGLTVRLNRDLNLSTT